MSAAASAARAFGGEPPPLVLVVTASAELRRLLTAYLLSQDGVPVPAASGAHAEVICRALMPDLAVIDVPLPDTDGMDLVRTMTALHAGMSIAVCVPPDPPRERRYRAAGAHEVLVKPLDLGDLEQALGRLASRRRAAG